MGSTTDEAMVEVAEYETPTVTELGSLVDVTNGSGEKDTADMKQWYN